MSRMMSQWPDSMPPPVVAGHTALVLGRSFRCGMQACQSAEPAGWAFAWQEFADIAGPDHADALLAGLCRDECLAVSLVAAAQAGACPALKACAFALLETPDVDACLRTAGAFGSALTDAGHTLSPDTICNALALLPGPAPGSRLHG